MDGRANLHGWGWKSVRPGDRQRKLASKFHRRHDPIWGRRGRRRAAHQRRADGPQARISAKHILGHSSSRLRCPGRQSNVHPNRRVDELIAAAQRAVTRSIDRYAMFRQADGAAGASSAPPNYPAMLAPYGSNRPPWNVAGVDYYVGVRPGSQLQDWRTLNRPDLVVDVANGVVYCGPTTALVQNIDFSLGTGAVLRNGSGASSAYTVNNCKFGAPFPDAFYLQATGSLLVDISGSSTVTLTNCTFDGTGTGNGSPNLAAFVTSYTSMIVMYNLFYHPTQSVLSLGAASAGGANFRLVYKYNLICNHLVRNLNHRNEVQWLGQGATITSCQVGFNTSYQDVTDITATYGVVKVFNSILVARRLLLRALRFSIILSSQNMFHRHLRERLLRYPHGCMGMVLAVGPL